MTEEAAKLNMLGVKDTGELEKMTPQQAYVADREAVHQRMKISAENLKRKQETLKINILGLVSEEAGKIVGNKEQQVKGLSNQVAGKTQEKLGDLKEELKDAIG